jgi:hypothetical protein
VATADVGAAVVAVQSVDMATSFREEVRTLPARSGHCKPAASAHEGSTAEEGSERGSVKQVSETCLGQFRALAYELKPPRDPELLSRMERARVSQERGQTVLAATLAREVWTHGRGGMTRTRTN